MYPSDYGEAEMDVKHDAVFHPRTAGTGGPEIRDLQNCANKVLRAVKTNL